MIIAALLMSLIGLTMPASADSGPITAEFTRHCTHGRLVVTNGTGAQVEVRMVVDGTPGSWVPVASGDDHVFSAENPSGQTVVVQEKTGGTPNIVDTFTNDKPARCDDFAVEFADSCEGTTVDVTNNHGAEVYLRIYAPLGTPVYDDGDDDGGDPTDYFQDGESYTGTFPMSAGHEMFIEITFLDSRLIDIVAKHEFVATGCQPEPEFPTTIVDTCTGIKVTVTNDSTEPLPVQVHDADGAPGDEPLLEFEVPAGETKSVEVTVADGVDVLVTAYDHQLDLGRHTVARKDCPDLPKTGTDVKTIAFAGLGVLLAGAAVLFVLRQRRRKLTEQ